MNKVYLVSSKVEDKILYKIGYTKREVSDRIKEFKVGNVSNFIIESVFETKWASKIERNLHQFFSIYRISGEWFELNESQVTDFQNICKSYNSNYEILENYNTYVIERGGINNKKYK